MARIAKQLFERLDPKAYARAVEEMRQGDVIDVPALPAAEETDDAGPGGDDGDGLVLFRGTNPQVRFRPRVWSKAGGWNRIAAWMRALYRLQIQRAPPEDGGSSPR